MRIKKHPTGNQYLLTDQNVWVRNFNTTIAPLDINNLSSFKDYPFYLQNELMNNNISSFDFVTKYDQAIIVSDGYKFKEKLTLLNKIPANIAIIATNRSLVKWNIDRKIDFFLVNNPYKECMNYMPSHRYYPRCIASTRTYPDFIKTYRERGGAIVSYSPSPDSKYVSPHTNINRLDDYRNPICASISLAYKLGVTKLLLFCCDDSFSSERSAAVKLENNLWTYPQHLMSQKIIEGMLFWYKKNKNIKIFDHSSGLVYKDIPYITEEEVLSIKEK